MSGGMRGAVKNTLKVQLAQKNKDNAKLVAQKKEMATKMRNLEGENTNQEAMIKALQAEVAQLKANKSHIVLIHAVLGKFAYP